MQTIIRPQAKEQMLAPHPLGGDAEYLARLHLQAWQEGSELGNGDNISDLVSVRFDFRVLPRHLASAEAWGWLTVA